jgi:hypothetical protein
LIAIISIILIKSCDNGEKKALKKYDLGLSSERLNIDNEEIPGLHKDSVNIETRPKNVLLTGISNIRLSPIYKVITSKRSGEKYIGTNHFLVNEIEYDLGNNWNSHFIPGFEAVFGYYMVNVSHFDLENKKRKELFEKSVMIKHVYFPSFDNDTLNKFPVQRNYMMVSVYNEDTNKDGYINLKDLRRFYLFTKNGDNRGPIIPENYSVFKSEYDQENDLMFVFGYKDLNKNGQIEDNEPVNIYWVDLKDPSKTGLLY